MTVRALAGMAALSVLLLGSGWSLLWCLGGLRRWSDVVRLAGIAYLVGAAALAVALTLELVLGLPIEGASVLVTGLALIAIPAVVGVLRRAPRPQGRLRLPRLTIWSGLLLAALVLYLEALFRAARLQPLTDWDTWWVWALRAKAIFHFGDLEVPAFVPAGAGGAYPPGLSLLQAATFHALGSADVVTLHLLPWALTVAFCAAVVGALWTRARPELVLTFLLLVLVTPNVTERILDAKADVPLGYALAAAALLLFLWLDERSAWQLGGATVLLAGAMLTKREGLLLAACVLFAALAVSWRERRGAWPWLFGGAVVAFALALPWRLWFTSQGLPSDAPPEGYLGLADQLDRVPPAFRLVVHTLFDHDLWSIFPALAAVGLALAFAARAWRVAVFTSAYVATAILGATWVIASNAEYEMSQDIFLNPIVRLTGDSIFVLCVLAPLLYDRAWSALSARREPVSSRIPAWAPWALVLAAALVYPASMLTGTSSFRLPGGPPSFPSAAECERAPVDGAPVRVVLGYVTSYEEARAVQEQAGTRSLAPEVEQDGCGRLRVFVGDVPSAAAGEEIARAAEQAGLEPVLEAG